VSTHVGLFNQRGLMTTKEEERVFSRRLDAYIVAR